MTSINQQLKTLSNELLKEESDIKLCLDPITWYPDQNAWSVNIDARKLKRKESETLKTLHNFIVEHNTKVWSRNAKTNNLIIPRVIFQDKRLSL